MSEPLSEFDVCLNCGQLAMMQNDDKTWQCCNPDCLQYGVKVKPDKTGMFPSVWFPTQDGDEEC